MSMSIGQIGFALFAVIVVVLVINIVGNRTADANTSFLGIADDEIGKLGFDVSGEHNIKSFDVEFEDGQVVVEWSGNGKEFDYYEFAYDVRQDFRSDEWVRNALPSQTSDGTPCNGNIQKATSCAIDANGGEFRFYINAYNGGEIVSSKTRDYKFFTSEYVDLYAEDDQNTQYNVLGAKAALLDDGLISRAKTLAQAPNLDKELFYFIEREGKSESYEKYLGLVSEIEGTASQEEVFRRALERATQELAVRHQTSCSPPYRWRTQADYGKILSECTPKEIDQLYKTLIFMDASARWAMIGRIKEGEESDYLPAQSAEQRYGSQEELYEKYLGGKFAYDQVTGRRNIVLGEVRQEEWDLKGGKDSPAQYITDISESINTQNGKVQVSWEVPEYAAGDISHFEVYYRYDTDTQAAFAPPIDYAEDYKFGRLTGLPADQRGWSKTLTLQRGPNHLRIGIVVVTKDGFVADRKEIVTVAYK